jgi:hypothetical protein
MFEHYGNGRRTAGQNQAAPTTPLRHNKRLPGRRIFSQIGRQPLADKRNQLLI